MGCGLHADCVSDGVCLYSWSHRVGMPASHPYFHARVTVSLADMEKAFDEMLKMVILAHPNVSQHEDGDYIETSGLR